MSKIDIDRFVCDMMKLTYLPAQTKHTVAHLLLLQNLEYTYGEIQGTPLPDKEEAYIDEALKNGSMIRESQLAYAHHTVDDYKKRFSDLFKEMESDLGRCGSMEMYHGQEIKDECDKPLKENIIVNFNF